MVTLPISSPIRLAQLLDARYRCGRSGFDSRVNHIEHSIATVATFLRSFVAQALSREMDPASHHSLRRTTASILKICFVILAFSDSTVYRGAATNLLHATNRGAATNLHIVSAYENKDR